MDDLSFEIGKNIRKYRKLHKDENGKYLISGKKITGFTTAEERIAGKRAVVPFLNQKKEYCLYLFGIAQ